MPYYVENLIEGQGDPVTVFTDDLVSLALQRMLKDDFSQLPVIDRDHKPLGLITYESILRALKNFKLNADQLKVANAYDPGKKFSLEDELFDILDSVKEENAVLIVDTEGKLAGIVTSYDSTEYFRKRAEDLMYTEDIEMMVKEFIQAYFRDNEDQVDEQALAQAIQAISGDEKEERSRYNKFVGNYLKKSGLDWEETIFEETFSQVYSPPETKPFDDLVLSQYIELLLSADRWTFYQPYFDMEPAAVRNLLNDVRQTRNDLAHFRGELTSEQRDQLRFCADWLGRLYNQLQHDLEARLKDETVTPTDIMTTAPAYTAGSDAPAREGTSALTGKYVPLAEWLQSQPGKIDRVKLAFEEIEEILNADLPASAFDHREFWANDSVGHSQSKLWLEAGWRTAGINMTDRHVTFARIRERELAYIRYWGELLAKLQQETDLPIRNVNPSGTSWITFISLPEDGPQKATINAAFSLGQTYRIELYIDTGDQHTTKQIFDGLHAQQSDIETHIGRSLTWQRLDDRRASRIALYTGGSVLDNSFHRERRLDWTVRHLVPFYQTLAEPATDLIRHFS
jgi:CBS domain-containing protein